MPQQSQILRQYHFTIEMEYNTSILSYNVDSLERFTPKLNGWKLYIFTVSSVLVAVISTIVQVTVYRSLKRLGPRSINQMIIPNQVISKVISQIIFHQKCLSVHISCLAGVTVTPITGAQYSWLCLISENMYCTNFSSAFYVFLMLNTKQQQRFILW